jgi:sulfoxide reductase catalytic subunit YedY
MLIKKPADVRNSEITPRYLYLNRREFLRTAAGVAAAGAGAVSISETLFAAGLPAPHGRKLEGVAKSALSVAPEQEKPNTWEQITSYNNYYEFGTDKDSPSLTAGKLKVEPWTVQIEGE